MGKKQVLLVHGVNPDRGWPGRVRRILEPHFACPLIEYHEYDGLAGPIRAVLPVSALVFFLIAMVAAPVLWIAWRPLAGELVLLLGCVIFFGGLLVGGLRRRRVLRGRYLPQLADELGLFAEPPHVIAHSLGTWLTSHAMLHDPNAVFDRVIFAGSVVPRRFDWRRLLTVTKPDVFTHLRNEVGRNDWVVMFAGLLPFRVTQMGYGGRFGFSLSEFVHRQDAPRGPCEACSGGATAPIHNVWLDAYRHSDAFLGFKHIAELWLPDLWGYSPRDLGDFSKWCQGMVRLEEQAVAAGLAVDEAQLLSKLGRGERKLRERHWGWTEGMSLEQFMRSRIEAIVEHAGFDSRLAAAEIDAAVARALHHLFHIVTDAVKACDPELPMPRNALVLNPAIAINSAISVAIRGTPWV